MDSAALIELVRMHPMLYSKTQSSGSSIEQKNLIWKEISQKLGQNVDKCKAKWRNLRDSYQKSIKYRRELESIGKEDLYHEYKHESALSFLEVGAKRKTSDSEKRPKQVKKSRPDYFETSYSETQDCSPSHNVEYIIESEQDNTDCRVEEDDDEKPLMFVRSTSVEVEEEQLQETQETTENNTSPIKSDDRIEQNFCIYESRIDNENESTPQEEISYQEAFVNETPAPITSELDSWLESLKATLLSFPKVMRARAKKNINDVVSDLEISYLESIELDRSQNS